MSSVETNKIPTPETNVQPAKGLREKQTFVMVLISVGFFCTYMWLAQQMEGISFDTAFIAIFCTFLSSFIVRCFMAAAGRK